MQAQEYLTLAQAAALLPGKPHVSTMHRWRVRGVGGVILQTTRIGGRRYTTKEWLEAFIEATSRSKNQDGSPSVISRDRTTRIAAAEEQLFGHNTVKDLKA